MAPDPIFFIYAGILLLSLAAAVWRRKIFPLSETVVVTLIVGVGFTGLVYWIAPLRTAQPIQPGNLIKGL